MKYLKFQILLTLWMASLTSCDPSLNGSLKVYNQANLTLTVVAFDFGTKDSTTFAIQPNSNEIIKILGGLGNQKTFDCCPCEFDTIYIKTDNGNIKKAANSKENWIISNKSQQKKFGGEDLKCEFYVTQSDI